MGHDPGSADGPIKVPDSPSSRPLRRSAATPRSSERRAAACEVLAGRYRNLVRSCVRRYRRSPEPVQDRALDAGTTAPVSVILPCPTGETQAWDMPVSAATGARLRLLPLGELVTVL